MLGLLPASFGGLGFEVEVEAAAVAPRVAQL